MRTERKVRYQRSAVQRSTEAKPYDLDDLSHSVLIAFLFSLVLDNDIHGPFSNRGVSRRKKEALAKTSAPRGQRKLVAVRAPW
jgi:hypothetical protein